MPISKPSRKIQTGVTLIEMVIFIAIISIALTSIMLVYIQTTKSSADPMLRIRSIELAQSFLDEILLKGYDENTPNGGGCVRFPTQGNTLCIPPTYASQPAAAVETSAALGAEEGQNNRAIFDDVDDYHNLAYCGSGGTADATCTNACLTLVNESGVSIANEYPGYGVCIRVSFAGGEMNNANPGTGTNVAANDAKRIDVMVTDPLGTRISLSAYRLNY